MYPNNVIFKGKVRGGNVAHFVFLKVFFSHSHAHLRGQTINRSNQVKSRLFWWQITYHAVAINLTVKCLLLPPPPPPNIIGALIIGALKRFGKGWNLGKQYSLTLKMTFARRHTTIFKSSSSLARQLFELHCIAVVKSFYFAENYL